MSADRKADADQVFAHNLVTFGAVRAAQTVLGEIPATYPRYLTLVRNFTADEIKRDNVVLVGGQKSVPWDHLFDDQLNFITDYDYEHAGAQLVRNRNPGSPASAVYAVPRAANNLVGYAPLSPICRIQAALEARLFSPGQIPTPRAAAPAFLASEHQMQRFRSTLHADRFPYFEVLLKIPRVSGTFFDAGAPRLPHLSRPALIVLRVFLTETEWVRPAHRSIS